MTNIDIRSRLMPEEEARFDAVVKKYPSIDFTVQRCTPYRSNKIIDYMRLTQWDPDTQHFLTLTGLGWKDVHMIIAAISRSRGDYARQRLKEHGDFIPPCLTDELKSAANRIDPDGDPDAIAARCEELTRKADQLAFENTMLRKNEEILKQTIAQFEQTNRQKDDLLRQTLDNATAMTTQLCGTINHRFAAPAPAPAKEKPRETQVDIFSDEEIEKFTEKERRKTAQAEEAARRNNDYTLSTFIKDPEARRAVEEAIPQMVTADSLFAYIADDLVQWPGHEGHGYLTLREACSLKVMLSLCPYLHPNLTKVSVKTLRERLSEYLRDQLPARKA